MQHHQFDSARKFSVDFSDLLSRHLSNSTCYAMPRGTIAPIASENSIEGLYDREPKPPPGIKILTALTRGCPLRFAEFW
jgi:hypothetical protein